MFFNQFFSKISDDNNNDENDERRRSSLYSSNENYNNNKLNIRFNYCLFVSEEQRLQRKINQKIDDEIRKEKRILRRNLKLLLLGTGESGKSTFIRQMRIIHQHGYETILERMEYVPKIHQNLLTTILLIDHSMNILNINYNNLEIIQKLKQSLKLFYNYNYVESIININCNCIDNIHQQQQHQLQQLKSSYQLIVQMIQNRLPSNLLPLIKKFLIDQGVQQLLRKRNDLLLDSSIYYLERLNEILDDYYIPTVQDILHVRIPTNGINEYNFEIDSINFTLVDVGGQRTERRKWIHCFETVTTIIFIVAMNEFDQILYESSTNSCYYHKPINKLIESKTLFKTILKSRWFRDTSIVLFLNKYDLFEMKLINSSKKFKELFPEFNLTTSATNYVELAANFMMNMFFHEDPQEFRRHVVYRHFTCATNTDNIKIVFQAVKHTIMEQFLSKEIQIF